MNAASVLVVPLFVRNRVMGSLQLFGEHADSFSREDAQLLWMLSLVAESMLARDYSNETLLRFAFTDFLTGLKTRGYFEQQLDLELARAERRGNSRRRAHDRHRPLQAPQRHPRPSRRRPRPARCCRHPHPRSARDRYRRPLRRRGVHPAASGNQPAGRKLVAQRLRYSVEQAKFRTGAAEGAAEERITISIGVAIFPEEAHFKRDLLEAADAALYQAKAQGRNRVVFYSDLKSRKEAS